jgi:transcriptional regulator with XRE-family HTH domain
MSKQRDPAVALRHLARAIRDRRAAKNMSQEAVAGAAGISVRHFQKIETGEVDIRYTSLVAVASALEARIADLAG